MSKKLGQTSKEDTVWLLAICSPLNTILIGSFKFLMYSCSQWLEHIGVATELLCCRIDDVMHQII